MSEDALNKQTVLTVEPLDSKCPYSFEDLEVGMEASLQKVVMETDIVEFAEISGDKNPIHLDADYAAQTPFKGRIAHGMLTAGYISAVFGMEMPGPGAIYVSQTLNFKAPVRIGDTVTTKVIVTNKHESKPFVTFKCECLVAGSIVLEGEAVLMVPRKQTDAPAS